MLEKLKNIFLNKEKRIENLVSFLIILIITLIIINKVIDDSEEINDDYTNQYGVELAEKEIDIQNKEENLEEKLEKILSKISGVGDVSVLLTYSETSSVIPVYNINSSSSVVKEKDETGEISKVTENENEEKEVITDTSSKIVVEKKILPIVLGAIVTAEGGGNTQIKSNIISAVEAVTGLASHKIQVFEMEGK